MRLVDLDALIKLKPELEGVINDLNIKEVNPIEELHPFIRLIAEWFDHLTQLADDKKTATGVVMEDGAAFDEIHRLAKCGSEFVKMHILEGK